MMKTFLDAAFGSYSNGGQSRNTITGRHGKGRNTSSPTICVNPAVDDLEALECNCYEAAKASCKGKEPTDQCLQRYLCNHKGVCKEWKDTSCPQGSNLLAER